MAKQIRILRKEKGLTQQQLSDATGIPLQSISNYELGRREPNSKAMAILERYFDVSGPFLRGETDEREAVYKWEDSETMDAVRGSFAPLFDGLLAVTKASGPLQQKMVFDILVELRHVIAAPYSGEGQQETAALLLQQAFVTTTRFIDTCTRSGAAQQFEQARLDALVADSVSQYEAALRDAVFSLTQPSEV